ncbi:MAG: putative Leucine-rich repeat domain protein [Promethearchaeota archaeon]|jgi:Leucine-rich repeat (LRR) protein|nr:MAG: putative Leucine-rich repeat domain protein [Candidatus Lokiarchaeota archaeon]
MVLDPNIIWQHYEEKRLDKYSAVLRLISIIQNSSDIERRIDSVYFLESIGIAGNFLFDFFENLMISDSNEIIRALAIKTIGKYYLGKAFEPMCWAYKHESSMECILTIIKILGKIDNHIVREYLINELINVKMIKFQKDITSLIEENKLVNYSNQELALMLINYYIIKFLVDKFDRLRYKIKNGHIRDLDFSCIGHNIFNWNTITKIPHYIGFLSKLQKLDLKVNKVRKIPTNIANLVSLEQMDLSNNQIQIIPDSFSQMESLQHLNLRHNSLTSLPDSFGDLRTLRSLDLSHNKLISLPMSFKNLKNLENLKLYGNNFDEIPNELAGLNRLSYLEIGLNAINSIEQNLLKMKSLERLGLGGNKVDVDTLHLLNELESLKQIELYDNNIKTLPNSIGELTQVRDLSIHNNQLQDLPDSFSQLRFLKHLDISWNNLEIIPREIFDISSIETINLSGNKIKTISKSIKNLKSLKEIDISFNKIRTKSKLLFSLEKKGIVVKI